MKRTITAALAACTAVMCATTACTQRTPEQQRAALQTTVDALVQGVRARQAACDAPFAAFRDLATRASRDSDAAASEQASRAMAPYQSACERGPDVPRPNALSGTARDQLRQARDRYLTGAMAAYWGAAAWQRIKNSRGDIHSPEALETLDQVEQTRARTYAEGDALMAQALTGSGVAAPSLSGAAG